MRPKRKFRSSPNGARRSATASRAPRPTALRVQWKNLRVMYDFWGMEMRRYYQLETLARAVEGQLSGGKDAFIVPSFQTVLGPPPIVSVVFELFQEGRYQLIFRVHVVNQKKNRETFALVVAKNAVEATATARVEHLNLRLLHERDSLHVVEPLRGGTLYLPDRHRRPGHGRTIFAYVTRWLSGYHELGVGRNLQFFMNIAPPKTFTKAETEAIKTRAVEIIAKSYDPKKHTCMEMPQIASGDFVVKRPAKGEPKIKLIACRKLLQRMTPAKVVDQIVTNKWEWGNQIFRWRPEDPRDLVEGLRRALGREEAQAWLGQYRAALEAKRLRATDYLPVDTLPALVK